MSEAPVVSSVAAVDGTGKARHSVSMDFGTEREAAVAWCAFLRSRTSRVAFAAWWQEQVKLAEAAARRLVPQNDVTARHAAADAAVRAGLEADAAADDEATGLETAVAS